MRRGSRGRAAPADQDEFGPGSDLTLALAAIAFLLLAVTGAGLRLGAVPPRSEAPATLPPSAPAADDRRDQIARLERELGAARSERDMAQADRQRLAADLERARTDLEGTRNVADRMRGERDAAMVEQRRISADLDAARAARDAALQGRDQAIREREALRGELATTRGLVEEQRQTAERARQDAASARMTEEQARREANTAQAARRQLEAQIQTQTQAARGLEGERAAALAAAQTSRQRATEAERARDEARNAAARFGQDRDLAIRERDQATRERDQAIRERGDPRAPARTSLGRLSVDIVEGRGSELFAQGSFAPSARLLSELRTGLRRDADRIAQERANVIVIEGHASADARPPTTGWRGDGNLLLSAQRSAAVAHALIEFGIPSFCIVTVAFGRERAFNAFGPPSEVRGGMPSWARFDTGLQGRGGFQALSATERAAYAEDRRVVVRVSREDHPNATYCDPQALARSLRSLAP